MSIQKAGIIYLILINLAAYAAFGWDKHKARRGGWRIPERTLLLLALAGGSVGAWIGMKVFRHKTRKAKFKVGVLVILTVQCIGAVMALRIECF